MTPDLHPEALIDKERRGQLDEGERAVLDAHLAQCVVCRFERLAAADFSAVVLPALDVDSLVTNAFTARAGVQMSGAARRVSRRFGPVAAALVSTFAVGSLAAGLQWSGVWPRFIAAVSARRVAPTPAHPAAARSSAQHPQLEPAPPPREAQVPLPAVASPLPSPTPSPSPPQSQRERGKVSLSRVTAEARAPTPPVPSLPPETATSVFLAGNRARIEGQHQLAVARYEQLLATWPEAVEASQTRASLGRLLLDQGEAAQALIQLDAYLAGDDLTLREEVHSARAQAYLRLGRGADEQAAWRALLDEFPSSVHAARARARLAAVAAP